MVDYEYYDEGHKKFDLLIPIAIIILVALIFLGKTTSMFCGVPMLNSVLCPTGSEIRIAVLGTLTDKADTLVKATQTKKWFDGEYGAIYKVYYTEYPPESIKFLGDQLLAEYDMVILAGERNYVRPVKDAVEDYLSKGGKVLLVGDAALKDPEDAIATGWGKMGMPVKLRNYIQNTAINNVPTLKFGTFTIQVATLKHPILDALNGILKISSTDLAKNANECASGEFVQVDPTNGKTIAFLTGDADGAQKFLPAIVEGDSALGGKVVYFAFDPGCSYNMLFSTIEYLSGKNL